MKALAAVGGVVVALACARAAMAGPVPDTVQMAVMRYAVSETPMVRVKGSFATQWAMHPRLDSAGVWIDQRFEGPSRAMRSRVAADQVVPIPWQEISSLETDRAGSKGKGMVVGGLVGVLVGTLIWMTTTDNWINWDGKQHDDGSSIVVLSIGGGMAVGYLIGNHGARRVIYPPRSKQDS